MLIRGPLYTGAWPGAGARLVRWDAGGSDRADIRTQTTEGYLTANYDSASDAADQANTASAVLTADTWHFVEMAWDTTLGTNLDRLELYVDNALVAGGATFELGAFTGTPNALYIGNNSASGIPFLAPTYYDLVIISSDPSKNLYNCRNEVEYP